MTCYFRHLQEIFKEAGIEVTNANKRKIDKLIHEIVGVKYKDCTNTRKEIKKRIAENEGSFVSELKEKWRTHSKNPVDCMWPQ